MRNLWGDLARALAWCWWAAAALLTLLRWVDLAGPVPVLQSGLVLVGLSLVLPLLVALTLRAWPLVGATLALGAVHLALAVPWWVDSSVPAGEDDVVVAAANLEFGQGSVGDVAELVRDQGVDVLVLLEATPDTVAALEGSPVEEALPHRTGEARYDAGGTLVLSREPHRATPVTDGFGFDQVVVTLQGAGAGLTLVGAHTLPPAGAPATAWRAELSRMGRLVDDLPDGPVVVAGDLNASTGHPGLRELLDGAGLQDAHRVAGQGWVRTWPRESLLPAFVQIDHVLVRGTDVVDAGTWAVTGSDHLAVWARLSVP